MHDGVDHRPERIGHDMSLAALHQFSGAKAAQAATFSRFSALSVDNASKRVGFAPLQFARRHHQ
jgi:hypothetical protein